MPMIANKAFQLRAKEAYKRGETIPPASWDSLSERTRRALVGARFVLPAPESSKQKRSA